MSDDDELKNSGVGKRGIWTIGPDGKLIDYVKPPAPDVDFPHIITDEILGGIQSMADGRWYTSKSALRKSYRALGFTEVGNETPMIKGQNVYETEQYQKQLEEDVARAYYDVRDNNAELSEYDKERCKIVNKQLEEKLDGESLRTVDDYGRPRE